MLILSRLPGETIHLTGGIVITVVAHGRGRAVKIGIEAPEGVEILRGELAEYVCPVHGHIPGNAPCNSLCRDKPTGVLPAVGGVPLGDLVGQGNALSVAAARVAAEAVEGAETLAAHGSSPAPREND